MTYPDPWGPVPGQPLDPLGNRTPPTGPLLPTRPLRPETFAANAGPCKADCIAVDECDEPRIHARHHRACLLVFVGILRSAAYRYRSREAEP